MSLYEVLVEVRYARDLVNKQFVGKNATYVKVHVDDMVERTEEIPDIENPVWNTKFKFKLDHKPKLITFEVKDDRTLLPNAKLGNYNLDIDQDLLTPDQPFQVMDGEIALNDAKSGSLNVCVSIQPAGWSHKQHENVESTKHNSNQDIHHDDSIAHNKSHSNVNADTTYTPSDVHRHKSVEETKYNEHDNLNQGTLRSKSLDTSNKNMNQNEIEELIITVVDAEGLKKSDMFSKSDPYVVVHVGKEKQKSKKLSTSDSKNNDQNPIWNESFTFSNQKHLNNISQIEFDIMDDDILMDDSMGKGYLNINEIMNLSNNSIQDFHIPIQLKNKDAGTLHVQVKKQGNMMNNMNNNNMNSNNLNDINNMNNINNKGNTSNNNMSSSNNLSNLNDMNNINNKGNASNASNASNLSVQGSNVSRMGSLSSHNSESPNYKENIHSLNNLSNMSNNNMNNMNNMNQNMASHGSNDQMEITIIDAESNKKEDMLSKSDPYVKIYYGNEIKTSKTCKNDSHPTWNETFIFKNDFQDIKFELMDDDILKDDQMGIGYIDKNELIQLNSNMNKDFNIPLYLNNNLNETIIGYLHIQIRIMDQNNLNKNNNNYTVINEQQYNTPPSMINENINSNLSTTSSNIEQPYEQERIIHKLPSIYVQTQPTIIEKEIIYEKPIEIQSKIIHREKPIIIEQPIIKEKYEHYRESTEIINTQEEKINKKYDASYNLINEENIINNLKQERLSQYQDISPIIKKEQEIISLNPQIEQKPIQVYENETIFEQPIEIEKKHIEHVRPRIQSNVVYEENHMYEKEKPQIIQQNAETRMMNDEYYGSKDINNNMNHMNSNMSHMSSNNMSGMHNNNNNMNNMNNISNQSMNMGMSSGNSIHRSSMSGGNEEFVLRIIGAQSNNKEDVLSKSDMYVIIKNGQQSWKTKTIKNSNNPMWNEEFRINFYNNQPIELILMDNDVIKDDEMSRCVINRQDIMNNNNNNNNDNKNNKDLHLPLFKKNNNAQGIGYLHVEIESFMNQQSNFDQQQHQQHQNQDYNVSHRASNSSLGSSGFSANNYASGGLSHSHSRSQNNEHNMQQQQNQDYSHGHMQSHDSNRMNANEKINLTISHAEGLRKADLLSKSDPYVLIKYGNQKEKTKNSNGENPSWNQSFNFQIQPNTDMVIDVMDDDIFKDDVIGSATLSAHQLSSVHQSQPLQVPLYHKDKEAGFLNIQLSGQ